MVRKPGSTSSFVELVLVLYDRGAHDVTFVRVERRAGREAARCRAGGAAAGVMFCIGPLLGRVEIAGGPVEMAALAGRQVFGAALRRTDRALRMRH